LSNRPDSIVTPANTDVTPRNWATVLRKTPSASTIYNILNVFQKSTPHPVFLIPGKKLTTQSVSTHSVCF
jgi:hypothetical protein